MTVLKWLVAIGSIGYLGGLAALFFLQRTFIFPIPETIRTTSVAVGFPQAQEHILTTDDGEKIIVWHVPAEPGHPVILYFHGNGDFLAGFFGRFRDIGAEGIGVVASSYRGYAGSSGRPSEQGLLKDAAAAYAFATVRYRPDQIVAWGFSLGSGVAVALASERPIAKLILEAPYTSIVDLAASVFPIFPIRFIIRDSFRSDLRIARVKAPILIMHGARDSTIPLRYGERLFALAPEPKQFVRFAEGGHNDLDEHGAIEAARRFIDASKS